MELQDPFDDDSAAPGKTGSGKKALIAIVILVMLGAIGGIIYLQVQKRVKLKRGGAVAAPKESGKKAVED